MRHLTGDEKGGAFSAGADLKNPRTHTENSIADFLDDLPKRRRLSPISMLTDFAKPVVAAVNGYAIGIGCILTFCCDMHRRFRTRRMAAAPGRARHPAGAGRRDPRRAMDRQGTCDAPYDGFPIARRRGLSNRSCAVARTSRRVDEPGEAGGGSHLVAITVGCASRERIDQFGIRHSAQRSRACRSLSLHGAPAHRR